MMKFLNKLTNIFNINNFKIIIKKIIIFLNKYKYIFLLFLPLYLIDIITRIFGKNINFYKLFNPAPNIFSISWIILIIGFTLGFKKKIGEKFYLLFSILFLIMFLTNNVYYSMTKTFFDFNLLQSASEGAPYIIDAIKNCNILVYIFFILIVILIKFSYKSIPYKVNNNYIILTITTIAFITIHSLTPLLLGKANSELTWSSWKNPRNIYISFNDNNKSMKISGLYEYTFRNFYITFLKSKESESDDDIEFLNQAFEENINSDNKYSGIFKDKNLILIQLEGTDNWLIDKDTTPTLYNMMNNSINFTDHYSYYNGGGSTFNSEFAVNTGFITPLSYTQNAYTFNKNEFPYSLANIFKNNNYSVNAFHMNTGEYYSRTANYKNWGYDNYYGLIDIDTFQDKSYRLDRNIILNQKFNELLFNSNEKEHFLNYIITYSGHLPFSNTNKESVCKMLFDLENSNNNDINETIEITELSEEECIRKQTKETDYMIELMMKELEERELIDNTVIVVFTDHYLYTVSDQSILDKYKNTSNNLINKTPFFIYDGKTKLKVNKTTSQLNILPTILNLYGIKFNQNNYIGKDALNNDYEGIVFFSDYSWYNGNAYVELGKVTNNANISSDKLEELNYYVNYITKKNDLALKYNYFNKKKKEVNE